MDGQMTLDELIFKRSRTGYSVHAPRVPGGVATGRTVTQATRRLQRELLLHLRRRETRQRVIASVQ
jgi:hypothetical protein